MARKNPIVLYKYKDISGDGLDHIEDMLSNNRVWFPSPLNFNDPFDCRRVYDTRNSRQEIVLRKAEYLIKRGAASAADALAEAESEIPSDPAALQRWQEQQLEGHSRRAANTGILCLTLDCDNFIMWTHYAKYHTGVCVQFRVRDAHADEHLDFIAAALPVDYADRCPLINFVKDAPSHIVRKALLTKATPFRHELEWRIVKYDQGAGLKPIPKGIIGAVILGCQIAPAARERVINACAKYDGDVNIVKASLDPETYGLRMEVERTV